MIDTSTMKAMKHEWQNCRPHDIEHDVQDVHYSKSEPFHKFTIPDECGIMSAILQAAGMGVVDWGAPNAYDVTTWDP
jgi:hypothetical protein